MQTKFIQTHIITFHEIDIILIIFVCIFSVEVKLVTWNKDSHGLFDYESKNVDLKFIHVETPCEIYKIRNKSKNRDELLIIKFLSVVN